MQNRTEQIEELLRKHTNLKQDIASGYIEGEVFISDDSYNIKMDVNPFFSEIRLFPTVWETDERIPRIVDWHVYPDDGNCCFTTKAMSQVLINTRVTTLLFFVDEILVKYLENNSYKEIKGNYFKEEYAHGIEGIIHGYRDILQISDEFKIVQVMIDRVQSKKIRPKDNCYCGSLKQIRACENGMHHKAYKDFRKVDKRLIKLDCLDHFDPYLKKLFKLI